MNLLGRLYKNSVFILFVAGLLLACNDTKTNCPGEEKPIPEFCDNVWTLIGGEDSLPILDFQIPWGKDSLINCIGIKNKSEDCYNGINFKYPVGFDKPIKMNVEVYCNLDIMPILTRRASYIEVLINKDNQLLVDGNWCSKSELKYKTALALSNKEYRTGIKHFIRFDEFTSTRSLKLILKEISKGYLLVYEDLAMENFNSKLCQLKSSQLDSLKKLLPYKLVFQNEQFLPPPPPPICN